MRAVVALLAVVTAGFWAAPANAAPANAAPENAAPGASASFTAKSAKPAHIVTLISGDRLQVAPDGRSVSRVPTPGRDEVPLISRFAAGRLRVVPADAVPLLNADRLDPRLFDITGLLAAGDDGTRGDLPVIVTSDQPAAVAAAVGGPARDLATINSAAVRVKLSTTASLWQRLTAGGLRSAYRKIWLDGVARIGIDVSVPLVGAPAAWAAGYTGGGVRVGVLDTGVDADHPDLAGAIAGTADFTTSGDGVDRVGHGTHVASIIAGSGAASGGQYRGMAPDVRLYSAKVCESYVCTESSILAGMQWAARDEGLKVVNLSLGRPDDPGTDLLEAAVDTLTSRYGTLFVIAGGNDHAKTWSPASADAAVAVGATTENDTVAAFSNRGQGAGENGPKPDITAPGVDITAARSGDSQLPGGAYTTLSGTSMAAPHVAGAAAILAQQHPDWTPAMLKAALMSSATPLGGSPADQVGAGRLDLASAVASPVVATPASLLFDRTDTRTVTYHNAGDSAITLALSTSGQAYALDATSVTVPAKGDASVRVSSRTGGTGTLTAVDGDLSIHTALAGAPATVDLTVRFTGRAGTATTQAYGAVLAADGTAWDLGADGTVRLPTGTYTLDTKIFEPGGGVTLLTRPVLVLDRDTTVQMDARRGRPVAVAPPQAGASQVYARVSVAVPGGATAALQAGSFDRLTAAQMGAGRAGMRTEVAASWTAPGVLYSLAWPVEDDFITGFSRVVETSTLAQVRAEFGASESGTTGLMARWPAGGGGYTSAFDLPFQRTEYLGPGGGWNSRFTEVTPAAGVVRVMTAGSLEPIERWNKGVFGPAFPPPTPWGNEVSRTVVDPAWSADAAHGGPAPAVAMIDGDRITVGGTTWTFPPSRTALLPLSVVRFEPRSATTLGFFVQHQVAGTTTKKLDLEVSYDGRTWQTPLYSRIGERGVMFLRPGGDPVSLRATAINSAGSSVEQTMIRAFVR